MNVETKIVDKFETKVCLYGSRTPVPILERALLALPNDLLRFKEKPDGIEETLVFYGDNCLGLVLGPKSSGWRYGINMNALANMKSFETPEGSFVGVYYQGNSYTIRQTQ